MNDFIKNKMEMAEKNRAIVLAILLEKGPIKSRDGKAGIKLFEWFRWNGGTIASSGGWSVMLKELTSDNIIKRNVNRNKKGTVRIELLNVPEKFAAQVMEILPTLVWKAPISVQVFPAPIAEVQQDSNTFEATDPEAIAEAIVQNVLDRYLSEKTSRKVDSTMQDKFDQLSAEHTKALFEIANLRERGKILEAQITNLKTGIRYREQKSSMMLSLSQAAARNQHPSRKEA